MRFPRNETVALHHVHRHSDTSTVCHAGPVPASSASYALRSHSARSGAAISRSASAGGGGVHRLRHLLPDEPVDRVRQRATPLIPDKPGLTEARSD